MTTIIRVLLIIFLLKWANADRKVAMLDDLCRRFPKSDFCKNPPALPPTPDNQPLDKETYCRKYQLHYTYFCTTNDNQQANSKEFCAAYKTKCNTKDAPSLWSPDQIKEECTKRQALAEQYCTGNEVASIKSDCDLYRQYCKGQGQPPVNPVAPTSAPTVDLNQYCQANYPRYVQQCKGGVQNVLPQQPQTVPQQPVQQPVLPSPGAGANMSPDQINSLCTQNKALAGQFCTGNEQLPQVKQNCDLFRKYCVGGRRKRQSVAVIPASGSAAAASANFCNEFVQTCNNLPSGQNSQLAAFCERYKFTVDTFCPAYEIAENRIACNAHRYYCQNKPPFRDIDGVSGI